MSEVCPVSAKRVNEKVVRLNAFFTVLIVIVFLFTPLKWIIYLLILDLILRALEQNSFSPLALISKSLLRLVKAQSVMTDAAPKLFAAKIGLLFCILLAVFQFLGLSLAVHITAGIYVLAAGLDAVIGYCVGCKVYALIQKFV